MIKNNKITKNTFSFLINHDLNYMSMFSWNHSKPVWPESIKIFTCSPGTIVSQIEIYLWEKLLNYFVKLVVNIFASIASNLYFWSSVKRHLIIRARYQ